MRSRPVAGPGPYRPGGPGAPGVTAGHLGGARVGRRVRVRAGAGVASVSGQLKKPGHAVSMFFTDPHLPTLVMNGGAPQMSYPNFPSSSVDLTFGQPTPRFVLGPSQISNAPRIIQPGVPSSYYDPGISNTTIGPEYRDQYAIRRAGSSIPEQTPTYVSDLYSSIGSTSSRVSLVDPNHSENPYAIRWATPSEEVKFHL